MLGVSRAAQEHQRDDGKEETSARHRIGQELATVDGRDRAGSAVVASRGMHVDEPSGNIVRAVRPVVPITHPTEVGRDFVTTAMLRVGVCVTRVEAPHRRDRG
jgi:hypothetical protein